MELRPKHLIVQHDRPFFNIKSSFIREIPRSFGISNGKFRGKMEFI